MPNLMQPVSKHIIKPLQSGSRLSVNLLQQQKWYAVYTRPRCEKKVYDQLQKERIEAFLPLQTTIRQWSDRKKNISEPLFRCYLFVNITSKSYYTVLNLPGVVRFITFEGKAVAITEKQIHLIRNLLEQDIEVTDISDFYPEGTRVKIIAGPLIGVTGVLVEYAGKRRVIIYLEEVFKSILVNIPLNYLTLLK